MVRSRLLIRESRRLLLLIAERRSRRTGLQSDAKAVEQLRTDLQQAEAQYPGDQSVSTRRALDSNHLRRTYEHMIAMARRSSAKLARIAPSLSALRRFNASVDVQALDDLAEQWTKTSSRERE